MKKYFFVLFLTILVPVTSFAAGSGEIPWGDLLYKSVNFFLLIFVLYYFAKKPITQFLRTAIKKDFEDFNAQKTYVEVLQKKLEEKISLHKEEEENLVKYYEQGVRYIDEEKQQIINDGEKYGQIILGKIEREIEQQKRKLQQEFLSQLMKKSMEEAVQEIKTHASQHQDRLFQQCCKELKYI